MRGLLFMLVSVVAQAQPSTPPQRTAADAGTASTCAVLTASESAAPSVVDDRIAEIVCQQAAAVDGGTRRPMNPAAAVPAANGSGPRFMAPPQSGEVPAAVSEALSIIAEIAVDHAKRQALDVLKGQLERVVCKVELPASAAHAQPDAGLAELIAAPSDGGSLAQDSRLAMPATCALIKDTDLVQLASDPNPLFAAIAQDLLELAATFGMPEARAEALSQSVEALSQSVEALLKVSAQVVGDAVARKDAKFTTDQAWLIVGTLLDQIAHEPALQEKENADLLSALIAARSCVEIKREAPKGSCDLHALVGISFGTTQDPKPSIDRAANAERLAALATEAVFASKALAGADGKQLEADPRERVRTGVHFAFVLLDQIVGRARKSPTEKLEARELLKLDEAIIVGAVDGNQPQMLSAGAKLILKLIDDSKSDTNKTAARYLPKATAVLSAVSSYAATFNNPSSTDDKKALREARKQIIEDLITATTVRTNRYGDAVWSLGVPVGFLTGYQWIRAADTTGTSTTFNGSFMTPQLELPLGVAFQFLPGTCGAPKDPGALQWGGLHAMVYALDLGQFLAYRSDGQAQPLRWEAIFAPGAQLGFTIGTPQNVFVIAADIRYAPSLFNKADANSPGGALRFGVALAYYFPLFDFN